MNKKVINENYFEKIDCPKKAYWLGFIAADGYINKECTKLSICIKDLEILEKFKKDVETDYAISKIEQFDKRTNKIYEEYSMQISNKNFIKWVVEHGITHEKTNFIDVEKINMEYFSYFVAGLFDGDGSVFLCKNGSLKCSLISTEEILQLIDNELLKIGIKPLKHQRVTKNKENVVKGFWYKYSKQFLEYIYKGDKNFYLKRKYDIYEKNKNNKQSRNREQHIAKYDLDGNFIELYNTIKEAGEKNGFFSSNMKKNNYFLKGFYWKYYEEFEVPLNKIEIPKKEVIKQYTKDNILINTFNTITEAEKITGVKRITINHCILGYYKTAGGFIWKREK